MSAPRHPPEAGARRGDVLAVVLLSSAGLVLSLLLARVHAQAAAGAGPSFCSLGEAVNCDRVAASRYSQLLGIPLALWGAFGYASMLLLSAAGLRARAASSPWASGVVVLLAGVAAAATVPLALASAFVLRTVCLLCAATWLVDWALLAFAVRASRSAGGPVAAVRSDARRVAARPGRTLARAAVGAGAVAGALAATSAAFTAAAPAPPPAAASATGSRAPARAGTAASPGPLTIYEYSDYECPHCARAHAALRAAVASRPDVRLEHRNFPLDQACNPLVLRPFHQGACALARAALCAGDQGRFWEMNDALYANQSAGRPLEEVARGVGVDVAALRRCQDAPETVRRLEAEIAAGMRAGISATPTYVVGGAVYQGAVPARVLDRAE